MKKTILLYQDQKEVFDTLSDEHAGKLIKAIFHYQENGKIILEDSFLKIIMIPIRQAIDRNAEKYESVCKRNAENISKRWNKSYTKNTSGKNGIIENTKNTDSDSNNDNDNDKDKGSKNKHNTILSEQKFERFWDLYDKKQDMQKCKDKFCKLSEQEQNRILEVVCLYVAKTPDKQFRKNPLTWLNGKCWLDDYSDVQVKTINPKPERKQFFLTTEYEQAVAEWEAKNKPSGLHDIQGHLL